MIKAKETLRVLALIQVSMRYIGFAMWWWSDGSDSDVGVV